MNRDPQELESVIGISFSNKTLLTRALTHRSYLNEREGQGLRNNERLEFLGDAVLELVTTEFLFSRFPEEKEGTLTAYRAALVNTETLSSVAASLQMDDYLQMSKGERMDTEKGRMHILANTFEAVVGAIHLDQGYGVARDFIARNLFHLIDEIIEKGLFRDPKSYFQEKAQEVEKVTPHYEMVSEQGPDHDKTFTMAVFVGDQKVAEGTGISKQKAETEAARNALEAKGW
tara:strand:- start:368 stop:1060 length:693 start_codon:yes stop_codon:yes gene_type:complete